MTDNWTCPACGIEIGDDETPCSLEPGYKCGAEMSRDDLREEVTRMAHIATARERLLAEYIRAIARCYAALLTGEPHHVADAIAICQGRKSAWTTSQYAPSCASSPTTSSAVGS